MSFIIVDWVHISSDLYIHSTVEYVENITVNVTMVKRPSSRQIGCVTASKVYRSQVSTACILCCVQWLSHGLYTCMHTYTARWLLWVYTPSIDLHRGTHLTNQCYSRRKTLKAILSGCVITILQWGEFGVHIWLNWLEYWRTCLHATVKFACLAMYGISELLTLHRQVHEWLCL